MAKQRGDTRVPGDSELPENLVTSTKAVMSETKNAETEPGSTSKAFSVFTQHGKISLSRTFTMEEVQKARGWFSSLSGDEHLIALGFQDQEFLDTLSRAWTCCAERRAVDRQSATVDWMSSIPSQFFEAEGACANNLIDEENTEQVLDENAAGLLVSGREEEAIDSKSTIETTFPIGDTLVNPPVFTTETGFDVSEKKVSEDSDDFRIRAEGCADERLISLPVGDPEAESSDVHVDEATSLGVLDVGSKTEENSMGNGGDRGLIQSFGSSVVAIFPPVSELVARKIDASANTTTPVVSLQPSYLLNKNGEEVLALFDEIMGAGKFLSGPLDEDWHVAVRALSFGSIAEETPLYKLLLMRLQLAVVKSYGKAPTHVALGSAIATTATDAMLPSANSDGDITDAVRNIRVVDDLAQSSLGNMESQSLVELIPLIFERLSSLDDNDKEKTVWDLGALLTASSNYDSMAAALHAINDDVAQRIRDVVSPAVISFVADQADEDEAPVGLTTIVALESEIHNDAAEDLIEGLNAGSDVVGRKNSKKRKKRRKRKGSAPQKRTGTDEELNLRSNGVLDDSLPLTPPRVDESTQTDDVVASEAMEGEGLSTTTKNTVETFEVTVDSIQRTSSHSSKSSEDESNGSRTDASPQKDEEQVQKMNTSNVSQMPRVGGVGDVLVTPALTTEGTKNDEESIAPDYDAPPSAPEEPDEDDQDEWATVEVRTRGNRKKPNERNNNSGRFSAPHGQNGTNAKKKAPRNSETRKRNHRRKMARDILLSVLDTVHEQVMKRSQRPQHRPTLSSTPRPPPNAWGTIQTKKNTSTTNLENATNIEKNPRVGRTTGEGATIRDILMGNSNDSAIKGHADPSHQQEREKSANVTADQNTAPTLTETLSSVSAVTEARSTKNIRVASGVAAGESSSNESLDATKPQNNSNQSQETQISPPLPTLLSPGNSATSSVASSLEAPHAVHHNHLSCVGNENDVGYHLLRVCDRLTHDIGNFMKRREEALKMRRHERKLVLSALQDSLTSIWPGGCKVQMYGSCATDLDLPSSDLDVVVCGLDQSESAAMLARSQGLSLSPSKPDVQSSQSEKVAADRTSTEESGPSQSPEKQICGDGTLPLYPLNGKPMTTNAERVVTLALELERQPWAVHVKAIPTATVPVIKILADPARFQGGTRAGGEWLVHHPQSSPSPSSSEPNDKIPPYPNAQSLMPWRGADVVNGLLSVDITFEGPEHGGIGSTIFSTRVVDEFSRESGLPSDSTAPVQVLMVLKELLAQRRLNEPFSGGLSSYALLLLVISLVRERGIIRKELELVERQRKLVAAGGGNAVPQDPPQHPVGNQKNGRTSSDGTRSQDQKKQGKLLEQAFSAKSKSVTPSSPANAFAPINEKAKKHEKSEGEGVRASGTVGTQRSSPASSSWASVAGKTSLPQLSKMTNQDGGDSDATVEKKNSTPKKMGSFADAASKGISKAVANVESTTKMHPNTADLAKGKSKSTENKQVIGTVSGSGKNKGGTDVAQGKTMTSKLPATASVFEPNSTPSHNGSVPTKPNTSMADESSSFFPQSFHDVIEVLCSGETTPGKLLMHFLLFYGQHFDSHSTAIDYSNTHARDPNANNGYAVPSPYMQRRNTGFYDPVTGMFTVDPIVIFDPLVGAEANNVARSCFAWSSIRWVFAQSYMTLSSAVEMSAGHHPEQGNQPINSPTQDPSTWQRESNSSRQQEAPWGVPYRHDESGNVIFDPKTPLLELLLSF